MASPVEAGRKLLKPPADRPDDSLQHLIDPGGPEADLDGILLCIGLGEQLSEDQDDHEHEDGGDEVTGLNAHDHGEYQG